MRFLFRLLCLLSFAHGLGGCASLKKAQQRRQVAAANATLERYKQGTPPAEQLADLIDAHPALAGSTVRIVKERDTVRIPGATITVQVPAVSTDATDKAFIDSLMATAGQQFHAKDSATFAARLRAELSGRPRLSRDTLVQKLGPLTVKAWVDRAGRPHITFTSAPQKVGYEKQVHESGPIVVKKELAWRERFELFIKDAAGIIIAMLVLVGGIWLWFFIKRQREKQQADEPLPF